MGELDKGEKQLLDYEDVFADIVNVLLFQGCVRVREGELCTAAARTVYKIGGKLRDQERDVAKYWEAGGIRLALLGLENQTECDRRMAARIAGYDGVEYRSQMRRLDDGKRVAGHAGPEETALHPAVTLVLYYGSTRWSGPRGLRETVHIPDGLGDYVPDYPINVFEIAFLPDETISKFQSDFRTVAELFKQNRLVKERKISQVRLTRRRIRHQVETLQLLEIIGRDDRFRKLFNEMEPDGGGKQMFEAFDIVYENGKEEGRAAGMMEGRAAGMTEGLLGGLRALIRSLKAVLKNPSQVYDAVRQNAEYADVTEEKVMELYDSV